MGKIRRTSRRLACALVLAALCRVSTGADIPDAQDACIKGQAESTPSSEFTVIEDGSLVRHTRTTLEWQRCSLGQTWNAKGNTCDGKPKQQSWDRATKLAAGLTGGWRIPSGEELLSIVEKCHYSPSINPQVFPNTPGGLFWSASTDLGGIDRAWSVGFFTGRHYRAGKVQNGYVRLVRGTMTDTSKQTP